MINTVGFIKNLFTLLSSILNQFIRELMKSVIIFLIGSTIIFLIIFFIVKSHIFD